jgi:hypothetical protein
MCLMIRSTVNVVSSEGAYDESETAYVTIHHESGYAPEDEGRLSAIKYVRLTSYIDAPLPVIDVLCTGCLFVHCERLVRSELL